MNWFKLNWLLSSADREAYLAGKKVMDTPKMEEAPCEFTSKPYRNIFYSNRNLTVVFRDNTMISKTGVDMDVVEQVRNATSQEQIQALLEERIVVVSNKIDTHQEKELVSKNLGIFTNNKEFEVQGDNVYLKGVNLAMPSIVVASFIEILERFDQASAANITTVMTELDEQFTALKMFWLKLAMNSLEMSREDLLIFVKNNDVRITKNGNLVLYRRIVALGDKDKKLISFVSQEYYAMKKGGSPKDYAVIRKGSGYELKLATKIKKEVVVGNLQALYLNLPNMDGNTFTSYHQGKKGKTSIKVGGIYEIPDSDICLDNGLCAAGGLHAAAVDYDYSGFGDTKVVVLVNPSKAITVPRGETGKLRTTQMFVACVNEKPQGVHFDEGALSSFDEEYHSHTMGELEDALSKKSFEKLSVEHYVPAVSLVDLASIRDMLRNRISTIN